MADMDPSGPNARGGKNGAANGKGPNTSRHGNAGGNAGNAEGGFASRVGKALSSVRSTINSVGTAAGLNAVDGDGASGGGGSSTSIALVLFVVLALFVLVVVIVYIVYRMRRGDLQSVDLVKQPIKLYNMPSTTNVPSSRIPLTLNGQEFTFSFWLYLVEFQPTSEHKLLFMRGGNGSDVLSATPIVFLDARTNRLHISIKSNQSPGVATLPAVLERDTSRYVSASVDYVPLQRWVNVALVVQDNLLTVYLDGDMYTVENVFDLAPSSANVRPIFAGTSGDVTVGAVPGTAPTKGFLGKLQFFNHALMVQDVKSLYAQGPVPASLMSAIGLAAYGVRSPVYRVDS
jgi:hypothetical protein